MSSSHEIPIRLTNLDQQHSDTAAASKQSDQTDDSLFLSNADESNDSLTLRAHPADLHKDGESGSSSDIDPFATNIELSTLNSERDFALVEHDFTFSGEAAELLLTANLFSDPLYPFTEIDVSDTIGRLQYMINGGACYKTEQEYKVCGNDGQEIWFLTASDILNVVARTLPANYDNRKLTAELEKVSANESSNDSKLLKLIKEQFNEALKLAKITDQTDQDAMVLAIKEILLSIVRHTNSVSAEINLATPSLSDDSSAQNSSIKFLYDFDGMPLAGGASYNSLVNIPFSGDDNSSISSEFNLKSRTATRSNDSQSSSRLVRLSLGGTLLAIVLSLFNLKQNSSTPPDPGDNNNPSIGNRLATAGIDSAGANQLSRFTYTPDDLKMFKQRSIDPDSAGPDSLIAKILSELIPSEILDQDDIQDFLLVPFSEKPEGETNDGSTLAEMIAERLGVDMDTAWDIVNQFKELRKEFWGNPNLDDSRIPPPFICPIDLGNGFVVLIDASHPDNRENLGIRHIADSIKNKRLPRRTLNGASKGFSFFGLMKRLARNIHSKGDQHLNEEGCRQAENDFRSEKNNIYSRLMAAIQNLIQPVKVAQSN